MNRHIKDHFVKKSKEMDYRCRSVFKLEEIFQKFKELSKSLNILDIGAAPGGWSQYLSLKQGRNIVAIDLLEFKPINGVKFIKGDFTSKIVQNQLDLKYDLILSDACPEFSGIKDKDIPRVNNLNEKIVSFALNKLELKKDLSFLVYKSFENSNTQKEVEYLKNYFEKVTKFKPTSSRKESSEFYFICLKLIKSN